MAGMYSIRQTRSTGSVHERQEILLLWWLFVA
jgi:hypothetical protein